MSLFNNPETVFFLKPNRLEVYTKNERQKLDIPEELALFQEVLSQSNYQKTILEFLTPLGLSGKKVILLISEDLIYKKPFPVEAGSEDIKNFLETVPFENQAFVSLKNEDQMLVIAANADFIEAISKASESLGIKIVKALPASLINAGPNTALDEENFNQLINNKFPVEADLLLSSDKKQENSENIASEAENEDKETAPESHKTLKIAILLITLLISLSGLLYVAHTFSLINLPFLTVSPSPTVAPSPSLTPEPIPSEAIPSAQITPAPKEDLTFKILNGTGTAGKALQVSNILASKGFKNIETENAEGTGSRETIVIFSTRVSSVEKAEVLTELAALFLEVTTQEDASQGEFDVLITTGRVK